MTSQEQLGWMKRGRTLLLVAGAAVALLAGGIAVAATHGSSSEANRLRTIEHMRLRALVDADTATAGEPIARTSSSSTPRAASPHGTTTWKPSRP